MEQELATCETAEHAPDLDREAVRLPNSPQSPDIVVMETNLDDATGEEIGHATELLMKAGALDVYTTAVQMKKGAPVLS